MLQVNLSTPESATDVRHASLNTTRFFYLRILEYLVIYDSG